MVAPPRVGGRIAGGSVVGGRQEDGLAGEVSFDVVSEFDAQELRNALDQVRREVGQRYDFKGATVELEQGRTRSSW